MPLQKNAPVEASKPVSTVAKTVGNTKDPVQVTKFHSLKAPKGRGLFSFGTYIYFFGRPIVKFIIVRLRITYRSDLRNLQETTAESARTDCTITDENLLKKTFLQKREPTLITIAQQMQLEEMLVLLILL